MTITMEYPPSSHEHLGNGGDAKASLAQFGEPPEVHLIVVQERAEGLVVDEWSPHQRRERVEVGGANGLERLCGGEVVSEPVDGGVCLSDRALEWFCWDDEA